MKATKWIAVIYDTALARQKAIKFCDGLVSRFWEQFEFGISWWSLKQLEGPNGDQEATLKAGLADLVVFATAHCQRVHPAFERWVGLWLRQREEREGVLVNILPTGVSSESATSPMSLYLRSVAHRAGMDYLTDMPEGLSYPIPESVESCAERAQRVTALLDEILHSPMPSVPVPLG